MSLEDVLANADLLGEIESEICDKPDWRFDDSPDLVAEDGAPRRNPLDEPPLKWLQEDESEEVLEGDVYVIHKSNLRSEFNLKLVDKALGKHNKTYGDKLELDEILAGYISGCFTETYSLILKIKDGQGNPIIVQAVASNYSDDDDELDLNVFKVADLRPLRLVDSW
ncbi:hypothetical protein ACHQM5_017255 [Ranunculus cassubicifolius]